MRSLLEQGLEASTWEVLRLGFSSFLYLLEGVYNIPFAWVSLDIDS